MMGTRRFVSLGIAVLLVTALVAPIWATNPVTAGSFVKEWARTRQLDATDEMTALASLRTAGIRFESNFDPSKKLTRADVVALARRAGIRVSTVDPEASVSAEELDRFFTSFGHEMSGENPGQGSGPGNGESGPPFDPFTKARGKGKGKAKFNRTPTGD